MSPERLHVLGAGAVGGRMAVAARRCGWPVTLLLRDAAALSVFEHIGGIEFGSEEVRTVVAMDAELADSRQSPIRRLLVTVKAHQTRAAMQSVRDRLSASSRIVLLQNGMGALESAADLLPAGVAVALGTTAEGIWRRGPFRLVHAGSGETWFGPAPGYAAEADTVAPLLSAPDLAAGWDTAIQRRLWLKLAVNCAINPLTALIGCRNGLLGEPENSALLRLVCEETVAVLAGKGIRCDQPLVDLVRSVAIATSDNRSSMLQDVLAGRDTENEYITGYLVRAADGLGLSVPVNTALLHAVRLKQGLDGDRDTA
jgi:2-dehydropantoate 2-reductase